jgi:hypothetical protein
MKYIRCKSSDSSESPWVQRQLRASNGPGLAHYLQTRTNIMNVRYSLTADLWPSELVRSVPGADVVLPEESLQESASPIG